MEYITEVIFPVLNEYLNFQSAARLRRCSKALNALFKVPYLNRCIQGQIVRYCYEDVFRLVDEKRLYEFLDEQRCMLCYSGCNMQYRTIDMDFGIYAHEHCISAVTIAVEVEDWGSSWVPDGILVKTTWNQERLEHYILDAVCPNHDLSLSTARDWASEEDVREVQNKFDEIKRRQRCRKCRLCHDFELETKAVYKKIDGLVYTDITCLGEVKTSIRCSGCIVCRRRALR